MEITKFSDLLVWQKSKTLTILLFESIQTMNYSYKDQILRACLSISNNIAEGFGRYSPKEFIRYLNIAKGSNDEVQSMILIGKELKFFKEENVRFLFILTVEINKMITSLIKNLKTKIK